MTFEKILINFILPFKGGEHKRDKEMVLSANAAIIKKAPFEKTCNHNYGIVESRDTKPQTVSSVINIKIKGNLAKSQSLYQRIQ
jgi:hypothetical protein